MINSEIFSKIVPGRCVMKAIYFEPTLTSWEPLCGSGAQTPNTLGEPEGIALAPEYKNEVQNKFPHGLPGNSSTNQTSSLIESPQ